MAKAAVFDDVSQKKKPGRRMLRVDHVVESNEKLPLP